MALRKGQKELVERYRGGTCAIPAIPGGGKTHCLSLWAAEIISQGLHKPGKILIVTYMNSAVNNFRQRISQELQRRGLQGGKGYFVSTIHGLCLQILKEKPDLVHIHDEFDIVDGASQYYFISQAVEEWRKGNEDCFLHYLEEAHAASGRNGKISIDWQDKLCRDVFSFAIRDFKSRGISPIQAMEQCHRLSEYSLLKQAARIYAAYDKRMKSSGLIDFDDMLYQAKRLLQEDAFLLERYRKRYSFVCEDEAQDSNLLQSEILTLIAHGNLLRVGDSNQAICGTFTNSDFRLFKDFCEQPETVVYHITQSSRSTREIIDLANYFVRHIRDEHPVPPCRESLLPQYIQPVGPEDERPNPVTAEYAIRAAVFETRKEEAVSIVRQASHMLRKYPGKSIAILSPNSWKISRLIEVLDARGIPYEEVGGGASGRLAPLKKLGRVLDFLAQPETGSKLAFMVEECIPLPDEKVESRRLLLEFLAKARVEELLYPRTGGGLNPLTLIKREEPGRLEQSTPLEQPNPYEQLESSPIWREFIGRLDFIRELLEYPQVPLERLILHIADRMEFDREEKAMAQKVAADCRFLAIQNPLWRMGDLAAELLNPRSMFSYFAGVLKELKGYEPKPGMVTLTTYHKSKGLEWDIVFLSGMDYSDFPVTLEDKFAGEYWFLKPQYKNPQALVRAELEAVLHKPPHSGGLASVASPASIASLASVSLSGAGPGLPSGTDPILQAKLETLSERARLLYVGITRAKETLFLSGYHLNPGKKNEIQPSRYLLDLKRYIDARIGGDDRKGGQVP